MVKRWRIHAFDQGRISDLARAADIPSVVAQLLISRGVHDPQAARDFLQAKLIGLRDPDLLPGVTTAAARVFEAVQQKQHITVYGDYDADGITGTAILVRCLQALGAHVDFYVPNRLDEGYGLNANAVKRLREQGTHLVITVDCGIASVSEAELARQLGLQLIVTDHHQFGEQLPDAAVIVHPDLPESSYPFAGLCGAGVAFKLAWELCRLASGGPKVNDRLRRFLLSAVGLAAVGTVADVVPLVDENRILVRHGLGALKECSFPGVSAICAVTKLDKKRQIASEDIAFGLAPRLNAAGRLGQAELAVELLLTDSASRAKELALFLDDLNRERDHLERSILYDARKQLQAQLDVERDPAIVLASRDWHAGVIGIVAGRLADRFQRPTILIAFDELKGKTGVGSGRSALGLNLHHALSVCREHLVQFGGHAAAAGLRILPEKLEDFRAAFFSEVGRQIAPEDRIGELRIDAEAPLPQLTVRTVDQIQQMAPFGQANPRPLLCASAVRLDGKPRQMGEGNRHLQLRLSQHSVSLRAVAFGQGEWAPAMELAEGPIDVVYRPVINEFRGRRSVELHLVDWRPAANKLE